MEGFVTALRDATTPQNASWYAYKTSEQASREIIGASLGKLTGFAYPPGNIFMTNGATGAFLVLMHALIGPRDEVIFNSPPWFFYEGMILNSGGSRWRSMLSQAYFRSRRKWDRTSNHQKYAIHHR